MGRLDITEEAKLLQTIGSKAHFLHKKKRPLEPVKVAEYLRIMLEDNNGDIRVLSRRIDFSEDMIKTFLSLEKIPRTAHNLVGWGNEDGRLDFTTASKIARSMRTEEEMDELMKIAITYDLKKDEIIDIIQLRKQEKSLDNALERVLNFRPRVEIGYAVIAPITPRDLQILDQISQRSSSDRITSLNRILSKQVGQDTIKSITIKKNYVILAVEEDAYRIIEELPRKYNIEPDRLVSFLIGESV